MRRVDIDTAWDDFRALAGPVLAGEDDTPEQVRDACRAGRAWLLACDDGFMVLQYQARPATAQMQLLIWLALSRGPHGCIERHFPWVRALAVRMGVSRILFRTRRRGFARALPEGWKVDHVTWSLEMKT